MDRQQEDMQFLGLFGIFLESSKIILNFRRTFNKITLALILPLALIFLAHIEVSKIIQAKLSDRLSSKWAAFLLIEFAYFAFLLVFSLLSTSAVVYTVASIYTGRDVTFGKVMSVVPKVWKRLMVTLLCAFLVFFLYNRVLELTIIIWIFTKGQVSEVGQEVLANMIMILYVAGFTYLTMVWPLASVVSVLEDIKGFKAMTKSENLIKGKKWIAIVISFTLNFAKNWILEHFESVVVERGTFGIAGRLGIGFLCLLMLFELFLFWLVVQTVIYFVCKSYHHENIDKSSLSDHREVYLGEHVPLMAEDVQLE